MIKQLSNQLQSGSNCISSILNQWSSEKSQWSHQQSCFSAIHLHSRLCKNMLRCNKNTNMQLYQMHDFYKGLWPNVGMIQLNVINEWVLNHNLHFKPPSGVAPTVQIQNAESSPASNTKGLMSESQFRKSACDWGQSIKLIAKLRTVYLHQSNCRPSWMIIQQHHDWERRVRFW